MNSIKGKCALVTGGGTGIGRTCSMLLAKHGAMVIVSDVNDAEGQKTVDLIEAEGGSAKYVHCDVSVQEEVKNMVCMHWNSAFSKESQCNYVHNYEDCYIHLQG